jgi:hypothetical protein
VVAFELDGSTTNDDLRQRVSAALSDFSLTPTPGWASPCKPTSTMRKTELIGA